MVKITALVVSVNYHKLPESQDLYNVVCMLYEVLLLVAQIKDSEVGAGTILDRSINNLCAVLPLYIYSYITHLMCRSYVHSGGLYLLTE